MKIRDPEKRIFESNQLDQLIYCPRDSSNDFLTSSTVVVEYEGRVYIFKETEKLFDVSDIHEEFRTF